VLLDGTYPLELALLVQLDLLDVHLQLLYLDVALDISKYYKLVLPVELEQMYVLQQLQLPLVYQDIT